MNQRPSIEKFFPENTSLGEAIKEYRKSLVMYRYIHALEQYADELEKIVVTLKMDKLSGHGD
jgi:hypothetical protein